MSDFRIEQFDDEERRRRWSLSPLRELPLGVAGMLAIAVIGPVSGSR
ncbi:hypothetical protein OG205_16975 [Lentzea sp. NBC_00516]|nr:hypothetical protein [Lentzea sp. NBC_00516]WUD28630.1 hypothetical protein OG205_16975 [Lentzea sp. NBC_00516]